MIVVISQFGKHSYPLSYCKSCYSKNGYSTRFEIDIDNFNMIISILKQIREDVIIDGKVSGRTQRLAEDVLSKY